MKTISIDELSSKIQGLHDEHRHHTIEVCAIKNEKIRAIIDGENYIIEG